MKANCTAPELWPTIPGYDASDIEIETFLDHLACCPYHAELEMQESQALRNCAEIANSLNFNAAQNPYDESELIAYLDRAANPDLDHQAIKKLMIKANDEEIAQFDLSNPFNQRFMVKDVRSLQLWKGADSTGPALPLAVYLLTNTGRRAEQVFSFGDHQKIYFYTQRSDDGSIQIELSYPQSQRANLPAFWHRSPRRALKNAIAALTVVAALLMIFGMVQLYRSSQITIESDSPRLARIDTGLKRELIAPPNSSLPATVGTKPADTILSRQTVVKPPRSTASQHQSVHQPVKEQAILRGTQATPIISYLVASDSTFLYRPFIEDDISLEVYRSIIKSFGNHNLTIVPTSSEATKSITLEVKSRREDEITIILQVFDKDGNSLAKHEIVSKIGQIEQQTEGMVKKYLCQ